MKRITPTAIGLAAIIGSACIGELPAPKERPDGHFPDYGSASIDGNYDSTPQYDAPMIGSPRDMSPMRDSMPIRDASLDAMVRVDGSRDFGADILMRNDSGVDASGDLGADYGPDAVADGSRDFGIDATRDFGTDMPLDMAVRDAVLDMNIPVNDLGLPDAVPDAGYDMTPDARPIVDMFSHDGGSISISDYGPDIAQPVDMLPRDALPVDMMSNDAQPIDMYRPDASLPVDAQLVDMTPDAVYDAQPVDMAVDSCVKVDLFEDNDDDGFGNPERSIFNCEPREGYVTNNLDCDDGNPNRNPITAEICDRVDNDCDGTIDEGFLALLPCSTLDALVGYWTFDEAGGDTVLDYSGHGHDGTIVGGAQRLAGVAGTCLNLNGTDQYATIASDPAFNLDPYTFSSWVRTDGPLRDNGRIIDYTSGPAGSGFRYSIDLHLEVIQNRAIAARSEGVIPEGEWTHVAATFENGLIAFYINGQLDSAFDGIEAPSMGGADPYIGRESGARGDHVQGCVDNLGIFRSALNPEEISELYSIQRPNP
ncbi:hypothetical protein COV20_00020 [Candidatus Woesearchaeota archaeon CG10_big_fil_rev_8_21_14_0_10_45_16]|nr:MAG: hypothetical protein COV20_00020 [Candidatus Woesearchaeota archaeon CG10_big_fil_rev_8_21_14_0_10_45_16]